MAGFQRRIPRAPRDAAASAPPDPHARGLALLARREWSVRQLRERLLSEGGDPPAVEAALARLVRDGALDDARVAGAFARTAARVKHRGRLRILRELSAMGIDEDLARAAVDEALPEDDAAAELEREISRRLKPPVDERQVRRVFAALVRRGFASAEVAKALRRHGRAGGKETSGSGL